MRIATIKIEDLKYNSFQTRISGIEVDNELSELANSIRENGLLQPIIIDIDNTIISGYRRVAACKLVGLTEIDCNIKSTLCDEERVSLNLVENIHRQDLTALEKAMSIQMLKTNMIINNKKVSNKQLAQKIGISDSAISKYLNLLTLDKKIQTDIIDNKRVVNRVILDRLAAMPTELKKEQVGIYNDFIDKTLNVDAAKLLINKKINDYYETDIHDLKPTVAFTKNTVQIKNIDIPEAQREDLEKKIMELINSYL